VGLIIEDPSNAAEIAAAEKLRNMGYPQKEIEKAEEWLNDIVTTFETARKQSERYSRGKEPVPVFDPRSASDLKLVKEDSVKRLFPKIRAIIHRRKAGVQRFKVRRHGRSVDVGTTKIWWRASGTSSTTWWNCSPP
jgi:hypothetical protein